MFKSRFLPGYLVSLLLFISADICTAQGTLPRVIVTSDGEVDDKSSFVRYLMYSNEFETEGLIYTNSKWQRHGHGTTWMQETIDEWDNVRENILLHMEGYPTARELKSVVFAGNMDEKYLHETGPLETGGARHIINILMDEDPRPVWIQAWGGTNTIAQALSIMDRDFSRTDVKYAHRKMRIYAVADQDSTAAWIREQYPGIFYIQCHQFTALNYQHEGHPYSDHEIFSDSWMTENVKRGHGPLGAMYPQNYFSEGDSPSFFHLIRNGLQSSTNPTWGGWGGRFVRNGDHTWFSDAHDDGDRMHGQWIWLPDIQNDFAARMDWCVRTYNEANHYPVIESVSPSNITVRPGDTFQLRTTASDPDGDNLTYRWWHYHYAGDNPFDEQLEIKGPDQPSASVKIPRKAKGKELHFILEVMDDGVPALKRYRRVILEVGE